MTGSVVLDIPDGFINITKQSIATGLEIERQVPQFMGRNCKVCVDCKVVAYGGSRRSLVYRPAMLSSSITISASGNMKQHVQATESSGPSCSFLFFYFFFWSCCWNCVSSIGVDQEEPSCSFFFFFFFFVFFFFDPAAEVVSSGMMNLCMQFVLE
ncbi:hypothetical protein Droror1_Dr00014744 [Drosera rotundifolia]